MSESLPLRLREETRLLHAQVERSGLMAGLLRGEIDLPSYCALLRCLHVIYEALEMATAALMHRPEISALVLPGLSRAPAIAADLAELHGPDWARKLTPAPTATEYAARLHTIAATRPELLVAHVYVRYLGDLSGGRLVLARVSMALGLASGRGTAFYRYTGPDDPEGLATRFRRGLGSLHFSASVTQQIVEEAKTAFRLHVRLFEELATG